MLWRDSSDRRHRRVRVTTKAFPHGVLEVDLLLIGAGPVGLYGAYYAGFRGLSVCVVDALPQVGGQIAALYPEKLIYDVAGLPAVKGQDLVDSLAEQARPFAPTYLLGQEATHLEPAGGRWRVTTSTGQVVLAAAVVVTGGVGAVAPRPLPCGEAFLGRGLEYFVPQLDAFDGRDVVVVGGGDSAVDWALSAVGRARSVTLVHRRQRFRAHEHSLAQLRATDCAFLLDANLVALHGKTGVEAADVEVKGGPEPIRLRAELVVAALGFTMQLGPIEHWGLELVDRHVLVDSAMRASLPGIYAAGDITTYPGKVKLIATGFGEVATAVNNAAAALRPDIGLNPGHSSDTPPPAMDAA
jgi:thioredoxin reductase